MIFRFMLVPMAIAAAAVTSPALAQDMSPPSQIDRDTCAKEFASLRKEAEDRGKLFKVERNSPPEETCQRIRTYEQAEFRMLKYAEDNATKCGIQQNVVNQLRSGRQNTLGVQMKVCAAAQNHTDRSAISIIFRSSGK